MIDLQGKYSYNRLFFEIAQIGTGGTGGYLAQRLSKLLYSLKEAKTNFRFSYTMGDGDRVEKKNLRRQPFIDVDLNEPKVKILADRYSGVYDIPIYHKSSYIEKAEDVINLFTHYHEKEPNPQGDFHNTVIPIIVGCVDNHATRKILHEAFEKLPVCLYIDSGIDHVDEKDPESGYSGHIVCGYKDSNKIKLDPVGLVYPDILKDKESKLPTQACGDVVVSQPQRMQTNEMAATLIMGYLNTILGESKIISHYTNFDARLNVVRSVFIDD